MLDTRFLFFLFSSPPCLLRTPQEVGVYTQEYEATNSNGLTNAPLQRTIRIVDSTAPVWQTASGTATAATVGTASSCTPKNNNACLQNSQHWGPQYTCNGEGGIAGTKWCTTWSKDMWRCCPEECNRNGSPLSEYDCDQLPGSGQCPDDYTDKDSLTFAAQCAPSSPQHHILAPVAIEAATSAGAVFAANRPIAVDNCDSVPPTVKFSVEVDSFSSTSAATALEDEAAFRFCGLGTNAGTAKAQSAATRATHNQDLMELVRACAEYTVTWTTSDDAGNSAVVLQVRARVLLHDAVLRRVLSELGRNDCVSPRALPSHRSRSLSCFRTRPLGHSLFTAGRRPRYHCTQHRAQLTLSKADADARGQLTAHAAWRSIAFPRHFLFQPTYCVSPSHWGRRCYAAQCEVIRGSAV
jgi:hypothetical protein